LQQPLFRYWVDEILWSQGRVATVTIEEVLDQMGGHRTGGPHKAIQKVPAAAESNPQQLMQHMKLSEQQSQQLQQQRKQFSVLSAGQPAVLGVHAPVSRSSSEATMHSSQTSSVNSLDSALASAEGVLPAEVRPLQPSNSAALHSNSIPSVTADDAAAAAVAAASDSFSSEDPPQPEAGDSSSSAGGQLGPTKRPDDQLLGYHHVKQWDILWTKSIYAIRAARHLQQGQIVSAIAGLNCLSMKKRMVQTLRMVSESCGPRQLGLRAEGVRGLCFVWFVG
jgi:hypothetical protein